MSLSFFSIVIQIKSCFWRTTFNFNKRTLDDKSHVIPYLYVHCSLITSVVLFQHVHRVNLSSDRSLISGWGGYIRATDNTTGQLRLAQGRMGGDW